MRVGVFLCGSDVGPTVDALRSDLATLFTDVATFDLDLARPDWPLNADDIVKVAAACDIVLVLIGPAFEAAFDVSAPGTGWDRLLQSIAIVSALVKALDEPGAEVVLTPIDGARVPAAKYPGVPWSSTFPGMTFEADTAAALARLPWFLYDLARSGRRRPKSVAALPWNEQELFYQRPWPAVQPEQRQGQQQMRQDQQTEERQRQEQRQARQYPQERQTLEEPPHPMSVEGDVLEGADVDVPDPLAHFSLSGNGPQHEDGLDMRSSLVPLPTAVRPSPPFHDPDRPSAATTTPADDDLDPFASLEREFGRAPADIDPVFLGITAPLECVAEQRFNAVLAVYIAASRDAVKAKLARLGGAKAEPLMDLEPDRQLGWRVGAPVTVRLTGADCEITPPEVEFDWSGRDNLAAFTVKPGRAAGSQIDLAFHVALAGVPIAHIPLPVRVAQVAAGSASGTREVDMHSPRSAFASYASQDADEVGARLSTLAHWAPGLTIFQDCLDLRPGEMFKASLQQRIVDHEAFLLFWSRRAAASMWVRWELAKAIELKGREAIIPMPLEDPSIAEPPEQLADVHMRDRFMFARYAWSAISVQRDADNTLC